MKKITYLLAVAALVGSVMAGCKKDDVAAAASTLSGLTGTSMTCTAGGTAFSATAITGKTVSGDIVITGIPLTAFPVINITIPTSATVAAHDLNATVATQYSVAYSKSATDDYSSAFAAGLSSSAGNITISKLDTVAKTVSGTFQVTVSNSSSVSVALTSGAFTSTYSK